MSSARPHILTLSYSSVRDDPRVVAEGRILSSLGYRVSILGVGLQLPPGRGALHGMDVVTMPLVNSYRPLFLLRATWALLRGDVDSVSGRRGLSTYGSLLFYNLWVLRLAFAERPDAIHCQEHQPLPAAWLAARVLRVKLVYDSHENTSLNRADIGFKGAMTIRIERFFLSRADAVITVGERLAQFLRDRGARRVVVVGNWKRLDDFRVSGDELSALRLELGLANSPLVISYFGWLDETRDIRPLLDAIALTPDVHLLIAGRGKLQADVEQAGQKASNIHWLNWLPLDRVPLYTLLSDVVYCCMNPSLRQLEFQMPNKLFDAFVARKAIIARQTAGEMTDLLERYPAGVVLEDVTVESLQAAFRLLQDPQRLREYQAQAEAGGREYNSDVAANRLEELFGDLLGVRRPRPSMGAS